jgi:hypothetical protein
MKMGEIISQDVSGRLKRSLGHYTDLTSLTTQLAESTSKLDSTSINVKYPPKPLVPAKGDGVTDDTVALQAILNLAMQTGLDVYFPYGEYKVTSPITVIDSFTNGAWVRHKWGKIYGQGFSGYDEQLYDSVTIKGYNIPAGRACLELLGESNGAVTSSLIENIAIRQDVSCNDKSFCLWIGDAWYFKAFRVKLVGKNCLKTRCGSKPGATSYAMISVKFELCNFRVENSTHGWAVMPESYENGALFAYDNIEFDSCVINGLMAIQSFNALLNNCLFQVSPANEIVSYSSSESYYIGLRNYSVDFSALLWLSAAANIAINRCYFEDYRKGIVIQPIGNVDTVSIKNCLFNGLSNKTDPSTGQPYHATNAIHIKTHPTNSGIYPRAVIIEENVFTDNRADIAGNMFSDVVIKNESAQNFIVKNNSSGYYTNLPVRISDTGSLRFEIKDYNSSLEQSTS